MTRHLKGPAPGHDAPVLDGILHCPQAISHGILDLSHRVLVGALDQDGDRAWVLHVLNKGVLVLSLSANNDITVVVFFFIFPPHQHMLVHQSSLPQTLCL